MPVLNAKSVEPKMIPKGIRIVEVMNNSNTEKSISKIKKSFPGLLISVRIPMAEGMEESALALAKSGADIIHLEAGNYRTADNDRMKQYAPEEVKKGIRSVHMAFVNANIRSASLLVSGGIAMAEHAAKAMLCGADAVFVDFQLLIALQCRMCRRCVSGLKCPVNIRGAKSRWVAARVVNLFGAWHNQLIEVMGAMGIRDARRLRGEVGRAMFFEDLDEATFGSLGSVGEDCELE